MNYEIFIFGLAAGVVLGLILFTPVNQLAETEQQKWCHYATSTKKTYVADSKNLRWAFIEFHGSKVIIKEKCGTWLE